MNNQSSSNPTFKIERFNSRRTGEEVMTSEGAYMKTALLLTLVIISASITWGHYGTMLLLPSFIGSIIFALITVFKKEWAAFTSPFYAICEGVVLGSVSFLYDRQFPGMVQNAIMLTMAVLMIMAAIYRYNIIRVTQKLKMGIIVCTMAIALVYVVSFIMSFFGTSIPMIHSSGPIGIGFSVFVTGLAAFNLLLDFDFINSVSRTGNAGKHMEWFAAFGLLVTLVWLYLEILRLLGKLNRR